MGIFRTELGQRGAHPDGVVKDVENQKGQNRRSTPDHHARGSGGGDCGRMLVLNITCRFVGKSELDGGDDVQDESDQKNYPGQPDSVTVKHGLEEMSVVIKSVLSLENQQVANQVTGEESNQNDAGESNNDFFPDG